jgi:hypothetical protein
MLVVSARRTLLVERLKQVPPPPCSLLTRSVQGAKTQRAGVAAIDSLSRVGTALAFGGAAAAAAACALGRTPVGVRCDVATDEEMQKFQIDYLVSMAASILRAGTYSPAPAETARERPSRADVELAVAVCRAYLTPATRSRVLMLSSADRVPLPTCSTTPLRNVPCCTPPMFGLSSPLPVRWAGASPSCRRGAAAEAGAEAEAEA